MNNFLYSIYDWFHSPKLIVRRHHHLYSFTLQFLFSKLFTRIFDVLRSHNTQNIKKKKNSDQIIIFLFFGTGFFKKNKNNDINFEKFKQKKKNPQSNCAKSQRNKIKKKKQHLSVIGYFNKHIFFLFFFSPSTYLDYYLKVSEQPILIVLRIIIIKFPAALPHFSLLFISSPSLSC